MTANAKAMPTTGIPANTGIFVLITLTLPDTSVSFGSHYPTSDDWWFDTVPRRIIGNRSNTRSGPEGGTTLRDGRYLRHCCRTRRGKPRSVRSGAATFDSSSGFRIPKPLCCCRPTRFNLSQNWAISNSSNFEQRMSQAVKVLGGGPMQHQFATPLRDQTFHAAKHQL